jgi:hypothetical protein
MSICVCERCDAYIDSDNDPNCFCDNPYDSRDTTIVCENCRERAYDEHQESLMESGAGPTLLEQQIAAMRLK